MRARWVCAVCLAAALLFCCGWPAFASPSQSPAVPTVDVGIRPADYRKLISDSGNTARSAFASVDSGAYQKISINARGAFSRVIGQAMPTKRIPFRIRFQSPAALSQTLGNASVVFVNSKMPMELFTEYIALDIYEYLGVPTPAHAFAFVRFNNQDVGIYLTVESVNGTFLEKHFENSGGSLYKSTYDYVPSPYYESVWFGLLEAKRDCGSETVMRLLEALKNRSGYEEYLDMDEVLRFFACTAAMGGEGSLLTERNNFFLYDDNGKIVLIPWDLGTAFDTVKSKNRIDCFYLDDYEDVPTPLFELIMRNPAYKERYHAYLREICDGFLAPEHLHPYVTSLVETLTPYLARDVSMFLNTDTTPRDLLTARSMQYSPLLYTLDRYYESLTDQLDGKSTERYYDPESGALQITMTGEGIASFLLPYSPKMDPTLPQRIQDGYADWHAGYLAGGIPDAYYEYAIAAGCFILGAAAVFFFFRAPVWRENAAARKRNKQDIQNRRC